MDRLLLGRLFESGQVAKLRLCALPDDMVNSGKRGRTQIFALQQMKDAAQRESCPASFIWKGNNEEGEEKRKILTFVVWRGMNAKVG